MTIGIIAEGHRDYDIIEAIVDKLCPGSICRRLQPESCLVDGGTYGGYKGVWQWCIKSKSIIDELDKIPSHKIDVYIIHLDGDTTRMKNLHCDNVSSCRVSTVSSAAYCSKSYGECPLEIEETFSSKSIEEMMLFLINKITNWIEADIHEKVVFCLPFDSPESWIVAAFDGEIHGNPELIKEPADSVIARASRYHGVRVKRENGKLKKSKALYEDFLIPKLCSEWDYVKAICVSANCFEHNLNAILSTQ